jgi:hypothetical protein
MSALNVLADLRKELDELEEFRIEDLTGLTKVEWHEVAFRDMEEDDAMVESEDDMIAAMEDEEMKALEIQDQTHVAAVEKQDKVDAEHIRLPMRPVTFGPPQTDNPTIVTSERQSERHSHS